jgi:mono/diheme cytochrome c family protein
MLELLLDIAGGLPRERRDSAADALCVDAMARRAGRNIPLQVAGRVNPGHRQRMSAVSPRRKRRIIVCHPKPLDRRKLPGDPAHRPVLPPSVDERFQLVREIAAIEPGEPRHSGAVTAAVQPVTGDARIIGPGLGAAHRDQLAGAAEPVGNAASRGRARPDQDEQRRAGSLCRSLHAFRNREAGESVPERYACESAGRIVNRALASIPLLFALCGCKPPPDRQQFMTQSDPAHGRAVIARVGCGSCHEIPGIGWPKGQVGPSLEGFADQSLIAGRVPNRPDILSAFVRNAPAVVPGSGMPPMPLTPQESRDVAAYLYTLGA